MWYLEKNKLISRRIQAVYDCSSLSVRRRTILPGRPHQAVCCCKCQNWSEICWVDDRRSATHPLITWRPLFCDRVHGTSYRHTVWCSLLTLLDVILYIFISPGLFIMTSLGALVVLLHLRRRNLDFLHSYIDTYPRYKMVSVKTGALLITYSTSKAFSEKLPLKTPYSRHILWHRKSIWYYLEAWHTARSPRPSSPRTSTKFYQIFFNQS